MAHQNDGNTPFTPGWYYLYGVMVFACNEEDGWARFFEPGIDPEPPHDARFIEGSCLVSLLEPVPLPLSGRVPPAIDLAHPAVRDAFLRWRKEKQATTNVVLVQAPVPASHYEWLTFAEDAEAVRVLYGSTVNNGLSTRVQYRLEKHGPMELAMCGIFPGYLYVVTRLLMETGIEHRRLYLPDKEEAHAGK
jgi:hypothetical protein